MVRAENSSLDYNSDALRTPDFKFELFPLHSPLLGESLLVSFPPLIDMLKFSGFSCPISDQVIFVCFGSAKNRRVWEDPPLCPPQPMARPPVSEKLICCTGRGIGR